LFDSVIRDPDVPSILTIPPNAICIVLPELKEKTTPGATFHVAVALF
jgi:hypothetical protein